MGAGRPVCAWSTTAGDCVKERALAGGKVEDRLAAADEFEIDLRQQAGVDEGPVGVLAGRGVNAETLGQGVETVALTGGTSAAPGPGCR